jgi:endoribonuclease Dicer
MRNFCAGLPNDRVMMMEDDGISIEQMTEKERKLFRRYRIPSTGALISYQSAMGVLAHFVDTLPMMGEEHSLTYTVSAQAGYFTCEVRLPDSSPVREAIGRPMTRKMYAKQSAAFEACIKLLNDKYLDENLLPVFTKQLPLMRSAHLALNARDKGKYEMKLKPDVWKKGRGSLTDNLYLTVLEVTNGLDIPHRALGLLTREELPQLPQFPIYLDSGKITHISSFPFHHRINSSTSRFRALTAFTLRVWDDIFAKTFKFEPEKMSYWLAPLNLACKSDDLDDVIDWALLHKVQEKEEYEWDSTMRDDFLLDKFLVDRWNGGRRWYSQKIVADMKVEDEVREHDMNGKTKNIKIIDYTVSLWTRSKRLARERQTWDMSQPVVSARMIPQRRNLLAAPFDKEKLKLKWDATRYLCPQPLRISVVRAYTVQYYRKSTDR